MTQEIYNYLWIRSILCASNSDTIIKCIENNNVTYSEIIKEIAELMQKEDLVLTSDEIIEDFDKVVQKYRFDNLKNKDTNANVNYIISKFQDYRIMPIKRRVYLMNEFFKRENIDRGFPIYGKLPNEELMQLIVTDFDVFISHFTNIRDNEKEVAVYSPIQYIALLNLLLSRFPEFYEDDLMETAINNINILIDSHNLKLPMLNYCKKTLKRFNKLKKEKKLEKRLEN